MIDIQLLRDDPELVARKSSEKGYQVDTDAVLAADTTRRELQQQIDTLRTERNEISAAVKQSQGKPDMALIERGKALKQELSELEERYRQVDEKFRELMWGIPNLTFDDVPVGDEDQSVEIKAWGERTSGAVDHLEFATKRDWVDFERGAKVAGAKFYYLKGDLALLENAITQYALDFLVKKGFTFMTVPNMVNSRTATGTGFAPRTSDQSDEYFIEGEDLSLIATAEMPLTGYHADEIIDEAKLPILYAGYSACYRKEAGTYGKHTRGLFRVHQFNKLEMYALTTPDQSREVHETLLGVEEELWQSIGIPYHVINIASGDLGAPAAKKFDIEYWSPVDEKYRELTSCSNCTDFQARNLNIRVRREDGKVETLHTLNGTAVSLARSLVVILENFQNEDGTLTVPEVLRPYLQNRDRI
jgi:seryl-tRNA synthetase